MTVSRNIENLVVVNGLQPPWDEGGTCMTANFIETLKGPTLVINRGPEHQLLGDDVVLVSVPFAKNRLLKGPAYLAFVLSSLYHSLKYRPESCYFVPLCAPGPLRQLHGFALNILGDNFSEILFQVGSTNRLMRFLSPFPIQVSSNVDRHTLEVAGFQVRYSPPVGKKPTLGKYDRQSLRQKYGLSTKLIVSHVGHLTTGRGIDVIAATARLCPDVCFLLVLSSRRSNFSVEFPKNVTILRHYIEDIHEIYALSDAYLFPLREMSNAITSPLSVLEAKSANIPILCSDFPSLRETIGEYKLGHFIPLSSVSEMAQSTAETLQRLATQ